MPTLTSRLYYVLDAPIPPADIDVLAGQWPADLTVNYSQSLELNLSLSDILSIPNISTDTILSLSNTLGLDTLSIFGDQNTTVQVPANVVTLSGLRYDWPPEVWPSESWTDFAYGVGDFYHEIIP